jgi:hypothetical protein
MVYASCKESVIENIEKKFGIIFEKKVRKKKLFLFDLKFNFFSWKFVIQLI